MDFVEEYSRLQTPVYKKIYIAVGILGVCGAVLVLAVTSFSSGTGSFAHQPNNVLQQSYNGAPRDLKAVPRSEAHRLSRSSDGRNGPVVSISDQGDIRGKTLSSRKGRDYFAFYKVPYAQPPPPQEPKPWSGLRDGTKPGPQCIQKEKYGATPMSTGEEDCLFLNVYTPELPSTSAPQPELLPVLFYLHGGGVNGNGTRYGAKYFMDEPCVLVTIEFRMGILGYFSTGTLDYAGNYGSKDQVQALKWVQKNIEAFGGDPSRVMIFGNSGGGMAVHSLLVSDMAGDLYHRAVMQSGNIIRSLPFDPQLGNQIVQKEFGCKTELDADFINCLRQVSAQDLVLSVAQLFFMTPTKEPIPPSGDTSNVFLSDNVWSLIDQGKLRKVPLISGDVSQEGLGGAVYFVSENITKAFNDDWNALLPTLVGIPDDANHTVAKRFREVYFGDKPVSFETRLGVLELQSDSFVHSQRVATMIHAERTGEPTFLYWMSKEPAKSYGREYQELYPPPYGVSHADELQFFFLYDDYPEIPTDSPWFSYSEALVRMWVTFAATGRPSSPGEEWKPIDLEDNGMRWYELGDEFREIEPVTQRMLLWDDYVPQLYYPK